ncbi:MAG TPA: hypothetical protein VMI94_10795 [Bryobacteraceae bacterium]|nr:hypothetical protein [Bryobacteraceae bacterium]
MSRRAMGMAALAAFAALPLLADFSYQETTRITGGALVSAMKVAGVFSKQARQAGEPIQSTVAIKGDRMVHRTPQHATVIDLASQTITSIDLQKQTYSVMTFDEMKQMMQEMSEKMHQNKDGEVNFKVSANETGKTKQIAGLQATEMVLKMTMEGTDKKSGQQGSMVITADSWIAPQVPGYAEVRDFHRRLAEKLNWTPGGGMFMSRPDVQRGMAEIEKESAKLDGIPVFQTTVMGGEGTAPVDRSDQPQGAPQQQSDKPSVGSALGSALGGRFGLGRKKQTQQSPPPSQDDAASAPGALLEMTTELKDFSAAPVDPSMFEVPANFKKIQHDYRRGAE